MATLTTTSTVDGILHDEYAALVIEPLQRMALAFDPNVSTVIATGATNTHIPVIREDAAAAWLTEGGDITPTDSVFDEIVVTPAKVGNLSKISRELADDSTPAAANLVGESLARDIAVKIDAAFFGDLSAPAPKGLDSLADYDAGPPIVDGVTPIKYGSTLASLDAFAEAISQAEERGATITSFVTTPAIALTIAKLKTGTGSNQPLLGVDASNGTARTVFGVPLLVSPAVASNTIWALDKSRVFTVLRDDVRVEVDRSFYFGSDNVAVKATGRVGFAFPSLRSIIKLTKGAA